MPSKQKISGQLKLDLLNGLQWPCNAIMTSSRCRNLHYVFLILAVVDCGPLTDPDNGQVNDAAGTTFRHTATYRCNTGYGLVGNRTRTCQATGNWSGSVPTCPGMLLKGDVTFFMCVCTQKHVNMYLGLVLAQHECMMVPF